MCTRDKYRQTLKQVLWTHGHLDCVNSAYGGMERGDQLPKSCLAHQFTKVLLKEICKILCHCNSLVSKAIHSYSET